MPCWTRHCRCASYSAPVSPSRLHILEDPSYINLSVVPFVHAQRLHFRDVRSELAVERRTPHTQEDAQLEGRLTSNTTVARFEKTQSSHGWTYAPAGPSCGSTLARASCGRRKGGDAPGLRAPQSAHALLPGTVLISSCRARSLRACWRLFRADAMVVREERPRCGS